MLSSSVIPGVKVEGLKGGIGVGLLMELCVNQLFPFLLTRMAEL